MSTKYKSYSATERERARTSETVELGGKSLRWRRQTTAVRDQLRALDDEQLDAAARVQRLNLEKMTEKDVQVIKEANRRGEQMLVERVAIHLEEEDGTPVDPEWLAANEDAAAIEDVMSLILGVDAEPDPT